MNLAIVISGNKNKLIILLLLLAGSIQTKAQDYIPLLGDTNVWYIAEILEFGEIISYVRTTDGIEVINDTTYTWIKDDEGGGYALIRENIDEKKVYERIGSSGNSGERLLYDFSKNEGEYVEYYFGNYLVDSIRYIETLVGLRKAWFLNGGGEAHPVWIEGIGSLAGLLMPWQQPNLNWWEFPELLCCEYNEEPVYKSENGIVYNCDFSLYDQTPPEVDSIWFEPDTIASNDTVYFYVKATDDISGVRNCWIYIYSFEGTSANQYSLLTHSTSDIYYCKLDYCSWNELGTWSCPVIEIGDNFGNIQIQTFYGNEGTFYVDELVGINRIEMHNKGLFPNPVTDISFIKFNNPERNIFKLNIYNVSGNLIHQEKTNGNLFKIQRNNFKSGIYFYQLINNKHIIYSNKFIIQ